MYFLGQMWCFQRSDVLSRPVEEQHFIWISHSIYNRLGKATLRGLQAPGRVHFWHSRQRMRHPAPVVDDVHGFPSRVCWSCTASCPAVSAMPLGIAGEQRATAPGMSVQQLNACTSLGKGRAAVR